MFEPMKKGGVVQSVKSSRHIESSNMPTEGVNNWEKWKGEEGGKPKPSNVIFWK